MQLATYSPTVPLSPRMIVRVKLERRPFSQVIEGQLVRGRMSVNLTGGRRFPARDAPV